MEHDSDEILLLKLKKGDFRAYDVLFMKYYKVLCLNALFFLESEEDARELVQLFFIDLWEKKYYLHLEGDIKGYCYTSVKNRCLNRRRQKERERKREALLLEHLEHEADAVPPTFGEAIYRTLDDALNTLPTQRKEAIRLVFLHQKKYQEAADSMGISINSLKTHLKLGLKSLRDHLLVADRVNPKS